MDSAALRQLLESRRSELFSTDRDWEQFAVYLDAYDVYLERNARYNDAWREDGAIDSSFHAKSKGIRVHREVQRDSSDMDLDDAYDGINYFAFFIRNINDGNLGVIDH